MAGREGGGIVIAGAFRTMEGWISDLLTLIGYAVVWTIERIISAAARLTGEEPEENW